MRRKFTRAITGILIVSMIAFISVAALGCTTKSNDSRIKYSGKVVTAKLGENPTTGYEWAVSIEGTSLRALDDKYVQDFGGGGKSGVGGTHTFRFEGMSEGTAYVHMVYERWWEPNDYNTRIVIVVETAADGTITNVVVK
ncbi:MAG: protease inhibitor I42 family protein [Eggerthellaceae bacterium]|nr:protease inhibitor I42 family protein [Eggerthellaceae bacterium]